MDEPVYCPKCEGTQHEHSLTNPRIHHPLVRTADYLVNIWKYLHIGLIVIGRHGSDEDYVPENYCCKTCGHRFLSSSTYSGEIRHSKELRKKCLFAGLLTLTASVFLALCIILDFVASFTNTNGVWAFALSLIPTLTLSYIFLGGMYYSKKESIDLMEEWTEFQDVQAKHTKTINSNSEEYIPAWKRVQTENQNQVSL